jgi:hypothetical protein
MNHGRPRLPNHITIAVGRPDVLLLVLPTRSAAVAAVVVQFDIGDLDIVEQHHWYAGKDGRPAAHYGKLRDTVYLARLLVGAEKHQRTRVLNGNAADLRRANIKICAPARKTLAKRAAGV